MIEAEEEEPGPELAGETVAKEVEENLASLGGLHRVVGEACGRIRSLDGIEAE